MTYRPLSAVEHSLELLNQYSNTWNIVTLSRVRGGLTEALVRHALAIAQTRHPMLQRCIVGPLGKPEFQQTDAIIPLQLVTIDQADAWSEVVNAELNQKLDTRTSLMRVVLVKCSDQSNLHYLVTTIHHGVCDGQATVQFHRELLSYCAAIIGGTLPTVEPMLELPPIDTLLPNPPKGTWGLLRGIFFSIMLGLRQHWHHTKVLTIDACPPLAERGCRLMPHQLTQSQTQEFITQCRQHNVTVHSGLCAALLKATAGQITTASKPPFVVSCDSAIDLRRRLTPPIDPTAFCSGAMWVRTFHPLQPETTFWELAQGIDQSVQSAITRQDMFNCAIAALPMMNFVFKHPKLVITTAFLSNLGAIKIPQQYGKFELEHIHFTASNSLFVGVPALYTSSFRNQMQLNFMFSEPALNRTTMSAIVAHTIELIEAQCHDSAHLVEPNPSDWSSDPLFLLSEKFEKI
jgi:hypothetical protein